MNEVLLEKLNRLKLDLERKVKEKDLTSFVSKIENFYAWLTPEEYKLLPKSFQNLPRGPSLGGLSKNFHSEITGYEGGTLQGRFVIFKIFSEPIMCSALEIFEKTLKGSKETYVCK